MAARGANGEKWTTPLRERSRRARRLYARCAFRGRFLGFLKGRSRADDARGYDHSLSAAVRGFLELVTVRKRGGMGAVNGARALVFVSVGGDNRGMRRNDGATGPPGTCASGEPRFQQPGCA